jgi:predicted dinucleotide-binding enzyme
MAFGTLSADLFESSSNRSPEPTVLFYATDDDRAGEEVERLIRTAGFEPVKVGVIEQSVPFPHESLRRKGRKGARAPSGATWAPRCRWWP